jgi:hypothetical protein
MKYVLAGLAMWIGSTALKADLQIIQTSEEIAERGSVARYLIQSRVGDFAVNPPPGWSTAIDPKEERLTFQIEKDSAVFSTTFSTNAPPFKSLGEPPIKRYVEEHWPNARIVEQSEAYSRDSKGVAVECTFLAAGSTPYRTRIAFIPSARGYIEFQLTAPDDWPPRLRSSWTAVLNSFQTQARVASRSASLP